MALECGGAEKVCVSDPGCKMGKNWRWRDRWEDKLEGQGGQTGGTKLLPEHKMRGGNKSPKNAVKCRKPTLLK